MAQDATDPFRDPAVDATLDVPATLAVGRNASLTLGTDALIVVDEALRDAKNGCCGLSLPGTSKTTHSIPFFDVLWAESVADGDILVQYAHRVSKHVVRPRIISYKLDKSDGQGNGQKLYDKHIAPMFAAARCHLDVETTTHNGHGVEIAQSLDIDKYDAIACCSGDGIPHEVWNGLAKRDDAARALLSVAVAQLPCGSGNAMSLNFNGTDSPSLAALAVIKGIRMPLDLVSVTQGDRRTLSFLSQSVGIVAECDLATEHLRWMGSARFTYGVLVRLLSQNVYPADIAVKVEHGSKAAVRELYRTQASKPSPTFDDRATPPLNTGLPPLKYGTVNDPLPEGWELVPHRQLGNFYAGNLAYMSPDANFFPAALPSDGCLDLVRIKGTLSRPKGIATMLAVEQHKFFDLPQVDYQKISAYRIVPRDQNDGYISIDGERVPFEPFQVEVHRSLGTVLSKSGHVFEAKGV